MKRIIFTSAIVVNLLLAGCGKIDREMASLSGEATPVCIGGVQYLQFTSGASVAYTRDGKVKTCN